VISMPERIFKPKLRKSAAIQTVRGRKDYRLKSFSVKNNLSRFYSQLFAFYFGGNPNGNQTARDYRTGPRREDVSHLCPDVVFRDENNEVFTEIKALGGRSPGPLCSLTQLERACLYELAEAQTQPPTPHYRYAICQYGSFSRGRNLHHCSSTQFVKTLAEETRGFCVFPLNFALYLCTKSPIRAQDQSRNKMSNHSRLYWCPPRGLLTNLRKTTDPIGFLISTPCSGGYQHIELEDCFLDRMHVEHIEIPLVTVDYRGKQTKIAPEKLTRFSLSEEDHLKWLEHFSQNHEEILRGLCLEDLWEKRKAWRGDLEERALPF